MATNPDRASYFPAIEKKYGQPMSYWFDQFEEVKDEKYQQQIDYFRENFGFSQAHANALVMYSRGSTSSRRFNTVEDYLGPLDATKQKTIRAILKAIQAKYPKMECVIAWNQPMLKQDGKYVFGVMEAKNHLLIAPFNAKVIDELRPELTGYVVNKKTIQVPVDWKVDKNLLLTLVAASLADA